MNHQLAGSFEMSHSNCRPDLIDADEVRGYSTFLFRDVTSAIPEYVMDPGCFYVFGLHPVTDERKHGWFHVRSGAFGANQMTDFVISLVSQGFDVFMPSSTFRYRSYGTAADLVWVFGLVIDYDGYGKAPFDVTFAIQTSCRHGQQHAQLHYLTSMSPQQGKEIGDRLRKVAEADTKTGSITQKWRFPGTVNYKNPSQKVFRLPYEFGPAYAFERLDHLLPALPAVSEASSFSPTCLSEASSLTVEELDAKFRAYGHKGPNWLADPVGRFHCKSNGQPDRSKQFWAGVRQGFRAGISVDDMQRLILVRYRQGCVRKYLDEHATTEAGEGAVARIIERAASDFPSGPQVPRLVFRHFELLGTVHRETGGVPTSIALDFDARTVMPLSCRSGDG